MGRPLPAGRRVKAEGRESSGSLQSDSAATRPAPDGSCVFRRERREEPAFFLPIPAVPDIRWPRVGGRP